ncbi:hypothetical protein AOLI_G00218880 [Acnodon oligacanthus]
MRPPPCPNDDGCESWHEGGAPAPRGEDGRERATSGEGVKSKARALVAIIVRALGAGTCHSKYGACGTT